MLPGMFGSIEPLILIFFVIFLLAAYLVFRVVTKALFFMVLGASFPFFLKYVLHMDVNITLQTVIYYAILAGVLYLFYLLIKALISMTKLGAFLVRVVMFPLKLIVAFLRALMGKGDKKQQRKMGGSKEREEEE